MSGSLSEGNLWSGLVTRWRQLRRDEGRLRLIEGLFRTATILLVAMMLAMTVDWTLGLFSVSARTALTLAALLATGLTFHQTFWKARQAPGVVPWPVPETRSESTEAASPEVRQLRGCALTLAMAVAVLVLLLLTSPRATSIYVTRFWLPFRAVSMTRVIASPVDGVTARGEPFVVTATTQGRSPLKATLFLRVDDEVQRIGLTRADTSQPFTYRLTDLREDFAYRVRSSDGQTPWHKVAVYDLPMVSVVRLRITPPAYSRLPVDDRDLLPRRCRALQGSRMEVIVEPAGPIAAAQIDFGGGATVPDDRSARWNLAIRNVPRYV